MQSNGAAPVPAGKSPEPFSPRNPAHYHDARLPWLGRAKMTQSVTLTISIAGAFVLAGHIIDQIWHPPFVSNVCTLLAVMFLNIPAVLLVRSVPERMFVRNALILAGVCVATTVVLDMTKDMRALDNWMVVGNTSMVRGELRWFSLVGGIFLLFGALYYAIGGLMDSRTTLQVKHQGLLEEMRQRRLAEEEAQAARDYAENLIQTANVIVIGLDNDRKLTVFNETAERITGYTRGELPERGWFDIMMPPDRYPGSKERLLGGLEHGIPKHLEGPILTKSGEDRQIAWSNSEVMEGGRVTGTISFGLDITDRKREEVELLRSSKLATLGVVAAGLAHEIGNPLASLSTRLSLMQEKDDPAFWRESIEVLQRQISRISRIVYGVARFSRPPRPEPTVCGVNTLVSDALEVVRFHEGAKHCHIGMELATVSPAVTATPDQLTQVFLNLGLNALEAMPDGGTLTVTTRLAGQTVEVAFCDTGTGLTDEASTKMFDAFYSSKAEGMGLGLNLAKSIISSHKGRIEFENNPGGGTCFRVLLPVADASSSAPAFPTGETA
jgi:PAS domain S-box-containing protein